jgi:U3 small nucleolar RNA-associated protein 14
VKQNRRSLKIDLIQEETGARGMTSLTSTSALVSSTDVKTEFEKEFRQAIEESGLNWMDNTPTQLPVAPAVQEDRERRQMARIRTLLRAEQIRARRLKKIKSKSYRKLLRKKEMQGMQDLIAKLDKEDPDAAQRLKGDLEKKLSSMRLNRQRQARLKWSKAAQRFGGREMRTEISKQSQAETDAKRELIRAIKGVTDNESDASDDDSDTSSLNDNDDIVAQIKKSINSKVIEIQREPPPENTKGLLGMKFMREAIIKQKADTIDEARHFMESLEKSESEDDGEKNGDSQPQSQQALVASLFSAPEEIICKPKSHQNVIVQQPKCEADPIPGWGDWVGEGVKEKRKRRSAVFGKPAPPSRPSSSAIVHLLEEDALRAPLMKYQVIDVPYPYKSSAEYEAANSAPIGSEWSTLTAHAEAIQPRLSARLGAVVPPIKLAKHLDADKRARIIDAWDNRKKLKHTKARFL